MTSPRLAAKKQTKMPFGRFLAWNMRPIALGAITILTMYFSTYCTDTLGMSPALVGGLLMASKIFDGVTDLIAGWLVDNTNTKWGKGRPYELCIIGAWVFNWLMFSADPAWSTFAKSAWIFCNYTLVWSVFTTMLNASETPYIIRAFHTRDIVVQAASFGGLVVTLGSMVVSVSFPQLMRKMATSAAGWSKLVGIYAIALTLIGLLRFIFVPEDNPDLPAEKQTEKLKVSEVFTMLKGNKYAWYYGGLRFVQQMILGMTVASYYFIWVVGDIGMYSALQILSIVSLVLMLFFPTMLKKMSTTSLVILCAVLGIIGNGVNFFAMDNMILLAVGGLLAGVFQLPLSYLQSVFVMDLSNYNEYKGMKRMESCVAAVANFLNKMGGAVGSLVMGLMLTAGGYDGTLAAQSESSIFMIRSLYSLIPMACMAVLVVLCLLYAPLNKKMPEINAALAKKEN